MTEGRLLFATCAGFVFGALLFNAIHDDERESLHRENKRLQAIYKPLDVKCPEGQVFVAHRADAGEWVVRCLGPRSRRM